MRDKIRTCKYSSVYVQMSVSMNHMLVAMREVNDEIIEKYDKERKQNV